ncbi:hypothetical protein CY34DRAFT_800911 [Suillus luteus UH-Slu-Lm8-n1]|uniref:Uncharacterized protein n=1 Tax=Suillus luteus UH-Slu-Lm8-n1 TaxID=930992 RepID=A0A0D0BSR0_9AGAM|nr:hypothetical protein CY34DRAFT_800911 [Suillus luteus UH-Slu-Lm8-n1]
MADFCEIIFGLVTCCCACIEFCTDDPVACSKCGCKKQRQDENLEILSPEVVQDQPQRRDPMIANDARSQQITTSGRGQNNMGQHVA